MRSVVVGRIFLWSLILFFSISFLGCQESTEPKSSSSVETAKAQSQPEVNQGAPVPEGQALELLQFGPSGEVPRLSQVVAMFNQPMVALGNYTQVPEGALTLEPELAGDFIWLNQYTLAFVPKAPLTGSLEVKATLHPEKLTALSGAKLAGGAEVTIRLPLLAVESSYLIDNQPFDEDRALRPGWRIIFNQEPDLADLEAKIAFVYNEGGQEKSVPATVAKTKDSWRDFTYDVVAKEPLPKNTFYTLVVPEGTKSLAGPALSPRLEVGETSTFGPLKVTYEGETEGSPLSPEYGLYLNFSNPVRLSEVVPLISLDNNFDLKSFQQMYGVGETPEESAGAETEVVASDEEDVSDFTTAMFIAGAFLADTDYTLTVAEGLVDAYGQKLEMPQTIKFRTGQYDTYLRLSEQYGLLETSLPAKLRLVASNINEARLTGYAFTAEEAIRFMTEAKYSPNFWCDISDGAGALKGLKAKKMKIEIPGGAKNGRVIMPVDLTDLFEGQTRGNVLYVEGKWSETFNGETKERSTFALTQISDIGLAIKVGPASSLIWSTNLAKGEAWPDVALELRDATGQLIWSGQTDESGLAKLPGTADLDPQVRSHNGGLFVVARAEDQMALWNVNWNDGLETWRWNMVTADALARDQGASNWLLNALPLYKPGETAKFKIIARKNSGEALVDVAEKTLKMEVVDGQGRVVESTLLEVGPFGTVSHELPIAPDASLGSWMVRAGAPGEENLATVGTFMVMTYRPPAFEIKIGDLPDNLISGSKATLAIKADYHFGAPVAGQPVNYIVTSASGWFNPGGDFGDYSFTNTMNQADEYDDSGYGYAEPAVTVASGEKVLTPEGGFEVAVDLTPAPEQKIQPRNYTAFFTVTDVDQRQVSNLVNFMVHPASVYAGLARDSYVVDADKPISIKVIAADHQGKLVPGQKVSTTLYRRVWQNVRRKSAGTAYEYVSKMVDEQISTQEVVSDKLPKALELVPTKPGYYWVLAEVRDSQGRVNQATTDFFVSGAGAVGWYLGNDDRLTLVPDKKEYKPGEVARIMVQSPFDQGEGLLTVERAGVRSSKVFTIESQTPVLEVPIDEDDAPNVYVSVLLTRGRIADQPLEKGLDLGKPALRLGYTELKVPSKKDLLSVEVTPDQKEVGPGAKVKIDVAVRDQEGQPFSEAEVALIVADAAVIQLAGEDGYFPHRLFQSDQPLMVQTADNLISLIGRQDWGQKGANPGGGGAMDLAAMAGMADNVRRLFAALAWFEPQVALDKDGRAVVEVTLPENLTTFKVYAVATGHGRKSGTGQSSILVTRDLLIRSALPGYAGVGDEFAAAMVVSNRGKNKGQATVKLEGSNFTLLEETAEKTVDIGPGESHEVSFRVKAGSEAEAKFLFTVAMGADQDKAEFTIPVSPPNKLTTQASYEKLTAGELQTAVAKSEGLDLSRGGLELVLSPSLLGAMVEPFNWLRDYPHGCVEQQTSQAYAGLVWLRLKDRLSGGEKEAEAARQKVEDMIGKLNRWDLGGGYNLWPGSYNWSTRSVYLSAYALDFVLSAQEDGFEVPGDLVARIGGFLKSALSGESGGYKWPQWYSERAVRQSKSYALAMLSRSGENVAAYIEVMLQERKDLSLFELINLVRAVNFQPKGQGRTAQLKELLPLLANHIHVTAGEIQFAEPGEGSPEIWSTAVRTSAMTLTALCEAAPHNELISSLVRWLVSSSRSGHFGTTQNNATVLAALSSYVRVMEPENPNLQVVAKLGESVLAQADFKSYQDSPVAGEAGLSAIPAETPAVVYNVTGTGQAWAALKIRTAPLEPDLSAATSGGFILSRSFAVVAPKKGQPGVATFNRGEVVKVTVTMMVPAARHNVVLEDRVPAGFEPINFSLADADLSLMSIVSEGQDNNFQSRFWYDHQEIWPDRVAVYGAHLGAGVYTYSYLARAVTPGIYLTPGPQAEEMYAPETFGRGEGQRLIIQ